MKLKDFTPLLNVRDCANSLAFYENLLGFKVTQKYEIEGRVRWALLQNGPIKLMINEPQDYVATEERMKASPFSGVVFYLQVDSVYDAARELKAGGYSVSDPAEQDYGGHECSLRDPDGYEISLRSQS